MIPNTPHGSVCFSTVRTISHVGSSIFSERLVRINSGASVRNVCQCLLKTEIFTDSNDSRSDGRTSTHPGTTIHHHTVISFSESPEQSRHCLLKLGLHLWLVLPSRNGM
jgi:hypothetical protein